MKFTDHKKARKVAYNVWQENYSMIQSKQAVGGRAGGRHDMPPPLSYPRRRADGNVVAVSHGQHVPRPTAAAAWRANTAVSKWAKRPGDLDLLTLKVVSESRVTWATSVPILVFLCLSVFDLGPMYATDRQTDRRQTSDVRQKHRLMSRLLGAGA